MTYLLLPRFCQSLLGISAPVSADQFTYTSASAPAVTSLSPSSGSINGGTVVLISGTNFTGATQVDFGAVPATSFTVNSSSLITALAPPGATGTVDVTVATPSGFSAVSAADQFTYTSSAAPSVTGVTPNGGTSAGGNNVTITGTNFAGANAVFFGNLAAASFVVYSTTTIVAVAPVQASGTVDVTITGPGGTSATTSADQYTYSAASSPSVTAVTPASGSSEGGMQILIRGSNFASAQQVFFGSVAAMSFTVDSPNEISAIVPAGTPGTVDVTVDTSAGTSGTNASDQFTY